MRVRNTIPLPVSVAPTLKYHIGKYRSKIAVFFFLYYALKQTEKTQRICYPRKLYQAVQKQNSPVYLL
jgi:hypothetical protein